MSTSKDYDVFRDSYIRYLGYSNELGESFRPLIHRNWVNLSYGIAVTYVLADCYDKAVKRKVNGGSKTQIASTAGDVFLWQMLASVMIPGFTINRITWATTRTLSKLKVKSVPTKIIPTMIGLASIPLIISPIDNMVDKLMDNTYRIIFK